MIKVFAGSRCVSCSISKMTTMGKSLSILVFENVRLQHYMSSKPLTNYFTTSTLITQLFLLTATLIICVPKGTQGSDVIRIGEFEINLNTYFFCSCKTFYCSC